MIVGTCKFCGCTENSPCTFSSLYVSPEDIVDQPELATCAWLLPDVCTNPDCVEKAYQEAWQFVLREYLEEVAA